MKIIGISILLNGVSFASRDKAFAVPCKWDYAAAPVKVTDYLEAPNAFTAMGVEKAFDGYGAQGSKPAAIASWRLNKLPTADEPIVCDIDYGKPIAVSAFVHYFYVPGSRDLRSMSVAPSAFRNVKILMKKEENDEWNTAATLNDLPSGCPQVLAVPNAKASRFWRLEIMELAEGADVFCSYEIETWIGGVPKIKDTAPSLPNLRANFAARMQSHKPKGLKIGGGLQLSQDKMSLDIALTANKKKASGKIEILANGEAVGLAAIRGGWKGKIADGEFIIRASDAPMGQLLNVTYKPTAGKVVKYHGAVLRMTCEDVKVYFLPAYVWSTEPKAMSAHCATMHTRMGTLQLADTSLCLIPGSDWGHLRITESGAVENETVFGPEPTPILVTAVDGDWWRAEQFAVTDVYDFKEMPQTIPVSEMQYGTSRYMMTDEVWSEPLGTVKSWPENDPFGMFVTFSMYGAPYSIPLYWQRWIMNGDREALRRMKAIALWLCRSGIRMQSGPAKGAFFNMQVFEAGKTPDPNIQGVTQARTTILTNQSAGGSLWALQYYRQMTGNQDPEINNVIGEAIDWILKTQRADGGWDYGHGLDGNPVATAPGLGGPEQESMSSSGSIWTIWALWRLAKETGDKRLMDAALRGIKWFDKEFVKTHYYHGYWEDGGPGTKEGYESAIAVLAFEEMGRKDLALEAAKDAMQWIFTRQLEQREECNSAGLASEQLGWPPAAYCCPMLALAAWTAWQMTGDDFWRPFAMAPKATGWWYQPEKGGSVWIVESTQPAPLVGPTRESYWCDWCVGQVGTLQLTWLIKELNRRAKGTLALDADTLKGTFADKAIKAWSPTGGFHPILPTHGQVNWLGLRTDESTPADGSVFVAFMNDGAAGEVVCPLDSRDVEGAALWPKAVHVVKGKKLQTKKWDDKSPVAVEKDGLTVVEWGVRK